MDSFNERNGYTLNLYRSQNISICMINKIDRQIKSIIICERNAWFCRVPFVENK